MLKPNTNVLKSKQKSGNKMTANNVLLYHTYRLVPCSAIIRDASSCIRWDKYRGPQQNTVQRTRNLRTVNPNVISPSNPSLRVQRTPQKRRQEECLPNNTGAHTYELTKTKAVCTGPPQVFAPDGIMELKAEVDTCLHL